MKIRSSCLALTVALLSTSSATLLAQAPVLMAASDAKTAPPNPAPPLPPASSASSSSPEGAPAPAALYPEEPMHPADCGDALSQALDADPNTLPCWSNIRTVDRWNTTQIPDADGKYATGFHLGPDQPTNFSFVLGSLVGTDITSSPAPHGYGGLAGASGLIDRAHWQLMFEDAGGGADINFAGSNNAAGINRGAIRAVGEINSRLIWQASVANTYGTDALRLFAPLDYRKVGDAQAVVADTVAYGLHAGRVTDEEEDAKLRYESSRRSNWDLVFGHTLQAYSDDGALIQTERGRLEYLHAFSPGMAAGIYGSAERQDGATPCSLSGVGLRSLSQWGSRASLNISGAINGTASACGSSIAFTGDATFSVNTFKNSSLFVGANRGLSGGIIEHTALLNSLTIGLHHQFRRDVGLTLSGAGILATDPLTQNHYSGTFEALAISYPLGQHFVQETSIRHFQVSPASLQDNRVIFAYTLWFNPRRKSDAL